MPAGSNFDANAQTKYGITLGIKTIGQAFIYKYMATTTHITIAVSVEGHTDIASMPAPSAITIKYQNLFTGIFSSDAKNKSF